MSFVSLYDRLLPARKDGGFRMDGYWVWCGSGIRGDDGKYHLFASRIPKVFNFSNHWVTHSEIVHAVADDPEGPYQFSDVPLPRRDAKFFDGLMTHNPTIHKHGDTYLLFYIGSSLDGPWPTEKRQFAWTTEDREWRLKIWANKRIGLATSKSLNGPWERRDVPILEPRTGKWDAAVTSNPAPCVHEDGSVLLVYKSCVLESSVQKGALQLGLARADHYAGPYRRVHDEPLFRFGQPHSIEDPYVWREAGRYHMVFKQIGGSIIKESGGGCYAWSLDGVQWNLGEQQRAYSRLVRWTDGTETMQGSLERPQLLVQDGRPTHLFCATANGPGGFCQATETWNMVIPLRLG